MQTFESCFVAPGTSVDHDLLARIVAIMLERNNVLRTLRLNHFTFSSLNSMWIFAALRDNTTLRSLDLRTNTVSSERAQAVVDIIRFKTGLIYFVPPKVYTEPRWFEDFIGAVCQNSKLSILDLSDHYLGDLALKFWLLR